jgi:hypothetical protein
MTRSRRPSRLAVGSDGDACRQRGLAELQLAGVAKQKVRHAVVRHEHVRQAVPVGVGHHDAEAVAAEGREA